MSAPCFSITTKDVNAVLPTPTKLRIDPSDPTLCNIEPVATDPQTHASAYGVQVALTPDPKGHTYADLQRNQAGTTTPLTTLPKGWEGYLNVNNGPGIQDVTVTARRPGAKGLAGRLLNVNVISQQFPGASPQFRAPALTDAQVIVIAKKLTDRAIAKLPH